jgi:hypothetical protein
MISDGAFMLAVTRQPAVSSTRLAAYADPLTDPETKSLPT